MSLGEIQGPDHVTLTRRAPPASITGAIQYQSSPIPEPHSDPHSYPRTPRYVPDSRCCLQHPMVPHLVSECCIRFHPDPRSSTRSLTPHLDNPSFLLPTNDNEGERTYASARNATVARVCYTIMSLRKTTKTAGSSDKENITGAHTNRIDYGERERVKRKKGGTTTGKPRKKRRMKERVELGRLGSEVGKRRRTLEGDERDACPPPPRGEPVIAAELPGDQAREVTLHPLQEEPPEEPIEESYLPEDTLLDSRYRILRILGHGNFSTTYLAAETPILPDPPDTRLVAIKRLKLPFSSIGENEYSLLEFLHGEGEGERPRHIISPISAFFSDTSHFHLVLEPLDSARPVALPVCTCGGHSQLACPARHLALAKIAVQLLSGLLSLHSHNLIHADLTPGNILFLPESNRVKLIDLGNTIRPEDREAYTDDFSVQSACYRAPEILLGCGPLSRVMDVWSAGVIAVEMVLGGVVVGVGEKGVELMRGGVEGREGMVRRLVELVGSVREYKGGMYYTDVYDDISLEPVVFTPRKRKRKGSRGRKKQGDSGEIPRVERMGVLKSFLEEVTKDVGLAAFLMDMMELGVGRRKTVTGVLKHPWLVRKLLGDWGTVLMGGAEGINGRSDEVEDQLELEVPREGDNLDGLVQVEEQEDLHDDSGLPIPNGSLVEDIHDDSGLPILNGTLDEELDEFFGVDIREQSTDRLEPNMDLPDPLPPVEPPTPPYQSLPLPPARPSALPYQSSPLPQDRPSTPPYHSSWQALPESTPERQLDYGEIKRESLSPVTFHFEEEPISYQDIKQQEDTDNSAPETSLITNDDTTTTIFNRENLLSSPPSSPPQPVPPLLEDQSSSKESDSRSPSPVAIVGGGTSMEESEPPLFGGDKESAVGARRASDVWDRDLAADMVCFFFSLLRSGVVADVCCV